MHWIWRLSLHNQRPQPFAISVRWKCTILPSCCLPHCEDKGGQNSPGEYPRKVPHPLRPIQERHALHGYPGGWRWKEWGVCWYDTKCSCFIKEEPVHLSGPSWRLRSKRSGTGLGSSDWSRYSILILLPFVCVLAMLYIDMYIAFTVETPEQSMRNRLSRLTLWFKSLCSLIMYLHYPKKTYHSIRPSLMQARFGHLRSALSSYVLATHSTHLMPLLAATLT